MIDVTSDVRDVRRADLDDRPAAQAAPRQQSVVPLTAEQVLEAALDLLLAAQEKRRASVPLRVKREVRRRDEDRCQWPLHDGGICGSTVRTEIDHVVPRGGEFTVWRYTQTGSFWVGAGTNRLGGWQTPARAEARVRTWRESSAPRRTACGCSTPTPASSR